MEYKLYKRDTYNIHTIKTDKFRSARLEITFRHDLNKDNVAINNVLTDFLAFTSKKYPTRREVVLKLEDLYGASFYSSRERIGNMITNAFMLEFLNPEYCDDKNYLEEVISFPFTMLFNPNFTNEEADKRSLKIIKNRLIAEVKSQSESASYTAIKNALTSTFPKCPITYNRINDTSDINIISSHDLYKYYYDFLNESVCDIYIIGNLEMEQVVNIIDQNVNLDTIKSPNFTYFINPKTKPGITNYTENSNFSQTQLVVVGTFTKPITNDLFYPFQVYLTIMGGSGLSSKLQQNLREKNSLCYTVSLRPSRCDGSFYIYSGIENKTSKKAISLIKKVFKEMEQGVFTDEELENAKKMIISGIKMGEDSLERILNSYQMHDILGTDLIFEREKKILKVTKEDVLKISKLFTLTTTYILKGNKK